MRKNIHNCMMFIAQPGLVQMACCRDYRGRLFAYSIGQEKRIV